MNRKSISHPYAVYHYFICSTFKKMSKDACTKHTIREDRLDELVLTAIRKQIELAVSMDELIACIDSSGSLKRQSNKLDISISGHEHELRKIENYKKALYEDWKNGDLTREEYHSLKSQYDERFSALSGTIQRLNDERKELEQNGISENPFVTSFKKHENIECLTRELVVELIDIIYIHEGGNITIQFKFEDEFKKAVDYIETNT